MNLTYLNDLTIQVRRDILRMVHQVNSGHPGGSLGCTEFMVALYQELMAIALTLTWTDITKIFSFCQTVIFLLSYTVCSREADTLM
jgi:transketolase N-terminal domain/subunit